MGQFLRGVTTRRSACALLVLLLGSCVAEPPTGVAVAALDSRCPAGANVINGTPANDTLTGTPGVDCIIGGPGNDTINGMDGNDVVIGSNGNDTVTGGGGNDDVWGDAGEDTLRGEAGADRLYGDAGDDVLMGGTGNDTLNGEADDDRIDGESGDDVLTGGPGCDAMDASSGADTASGGDGLDVINGGTAAVSLLGGGGDDWIFGGLSPSVVNGNDGTDRCLGTSCERAPPAACTSSASCGTGQACNTFVAICASTSFCGPTGGTCSVTTDGGGADGGVPCDDGNVCTLDSCAATACHHAPIPDGTSCDDGTVCDGHETCSGGSCREGTALVLDDGNACTVDSCSPTGGVTHTPITPDLQPDASCNGLDDDCDGHSDEDFVGSSTSCGLGVCARSGATSCVSGSVVDSCTAGSATGADTTCDGLDDDCDGRADESYAPVSTSCGLGVCAAAGITSCSAGSVVDSCAPAASSGPDTTCDGLDDDCDGATDEAYAPLPTGCGLGVCATAGATSCVSGVVVDSCTPGAAAGPDTTCDSRDDDCDGSTDEAYVSVATACGLGVCAATGVTSCAMGVVSDSCVAGSPAGSDTTCDSLDDDCDGATDEAYAPVPTACGLGVCAATGLTSCVAGAIVDTCTVGSSTGPDTTCDALDDDCDGSTDESYTPVGTSCGTGVCARTGTTSCVAGSVVDSCAAGAATGGDTTCDLLDDDCDGAVDESYVPTPTSCGLGACAASGATSCASGTIVDSCAVGSPVDADANCDGIDGDCDGAMDESYAAVATTCGIGICASTGATSCVAGSVVDSCAAGSPTGDDVTCDSLDDDCDGSIDESYAPITTSCGVGVCAASGATSCVSGSVLDSCAPGAPTGADSTCNALDDDCDGSTDESYASLATSCGVGVCASTGTTSCVAGSVVDSCAAGSPTGDDVTCDSLDDDCDGSIDESYAPLTTSCGVGVCAASGAATCLAGSVLDSCTPGSPTGADSTCNALDDDCDGSTDESYASLATSCGVGVCASTGATSCVAGSVLDSCAAGSPMGPDTTCDSLDDDCDGSADESYASLSTSCGVGVCTAGGATSCVSGAIVDSCAPGSAVDADASCDGVDGDCDGSIDESYVAVSTSCGVGACAAGGLTSCVLGAVVDSCAPGTPAASDATCDAVDDDCDGSTDESYAPVATSCGVGVCAASGATSCVSGGVLDSCMPGSPTGADSTCNALDDDCDGSTDESYASLATTCGTGVCASTGATSCVAGSVLDSCAAGSPTGPDATCDSLDDDCDGSTDESYAPATTSCGLGVCAASGATSCVSGSVLDSCAPGSPVDADASCDGVDGDCDGSIDESYAPSATSCGVGACAAGGVTSCVSGAVFDSCVPGAPAAADATCNAVDDDCDVLVDEDFAPGCVGSARTTCVLGTTVLTQCSNANVCDGVESCALGACVPGTPAVLDDGNPCTADACNPGSGVTHTPTPGGSCADGNACNGDETCSALGTCQAGTPPTVDDGNVCTDDSCHPATGVSHDPLPIDTSCADADPCNGEELCDGAGFCFPGTPPLTGPCAPAAPVPAIFVDERRDVTLAVLGASVVSFTGTSAPSIGPTGFQWTPSVQTSPPTMVLDLVGSEPVVLDTLRLQGGGATFGVRNLEVWVSTTTTAPGAFTYVGTFVVTSVSSAFSELALGAVSARFVQLRVIDDHLARANRGNFFSATITTRPRDGGGLSMFEAGVAVTASSNTANARNATDASTITAWRGGTPILGQFLTVDLPGDALHRIDRVRLFGSSSTSAMIRDFEVLTSLDGTTFTLAFTGTLPTEVRDYYFFFPEVAARFVRLRALNNRGFAGGVDVIDFQVLTAHEGGLTVPFQDRTTVGATPIIDRLWSFGDGGSSGAMNPTHDYPAAGSYLVRLRVADEWGFVEESTYAYEAHEGPDAFFTWTPATLLHAGSVTFTDRSLPGSAPLIRADWRTISGVASASSSSTTTGTSAPGSVFSRTSLPLAPLTASVTAVDAHLLSTTYTTVIDVENNAPTTNVAADQTLYWGQPLAPVATTTLIDLGDGTPLVCDWDFDDGVTVHIPVCRVSTPPAADAVFVAHAWATPGSYEPVLTVTDPHGATGEDRFFVEVIRRPTGIAIDPVPGASSGGPQLVTVRLYDRFDGAAAVAGRTVTLTIGAASTTAVTDTAGTATATLDFGTGATAVVRASFAGDALYQGSSLDESFPEATVPEAPSNCGREFWLAIAASCDLATGCVGLQREALTGLIATAGDFTTVDVEIAAMTYRARFDVAPGAVGRLNLPDAAQLLVSGRRESRAVHVTSARPICLATSTHTRFSTDSVLAIPAAHLGTSHVIASYPANGSTARGELAVAATTNGTVVTITPTIALAPGPNTPASLPAGVPFTVTLGRGEAIMLQTTSQTADMTGTRVESTAPVAVFSGTLISFVPPTSGTADYLSEAVLPAQHLGREFVVAPFGGRTSGYILRVISREAGTEVRVGGVLVATLAVGAFYELNVANQTSRFVETSRPALVVQLAKGASTDGQGDPFMMTVVPSHALPHVATFGTSPEYVAPQSTVVVDYLDWVTLVARAAEVGGVRLDGAPVTAAWTPVPGTIWAYAQVSVGNGYHRATHVTAGAPVGVYTYGWASAESYGHPAAMRLIPVACSPGATSPGNGLDDDCDGRIDEETANGLDDDGDSLVDEDLDFTSGAPVNVAPVAYGGRTSTREDVAVSFVLSGFDPNGDALTFQVLTPPARGVLSGTGASRSYAPLANATGVESLTFRVCDPSLLCSEPATFEIDVRGVNDPPAFDMPPFYSITEGNALRLPCVASEVDAIDFDCAATWELVAGPDGMTIDAETGELFWYPPSDSVDESITVTVRVTDCHGASATFTFGLQVGSVPDAPFIVSTPVRSARIAALYTYDVNAIDEDGDVIHFELRVAPPAMSIVAASGVISWTPGGADVGDHPVEVVAIDATGLESLPQRFVVRVSGDNVAPVVTVTATPTAFLPGATSLIHVTVTDDTPGAVIESATLDGAPLVLDGSGNATITSATPGVLVVAATGRDVVGNRTTASTLVRVLDASDVTAPVVAITAPAVDAELTYQHEATGSVFDDNLYRWTLELRRSDGRSAWRLVAAGSDNIDGFLGTIDTTLLENGIYELRLLGEDVNGQVGEDRRPVWITGGAKVGHVRLSFTDLVVPDYGFPLAVVRTYDSRNASQLGDFGFGWDLEMRAGYIGRNRAPGDGFAITSDPRSPHVCTVVYEQQYHFVDVRISEDEWYTFRPVLTDMQATSGSCGAIVSYEQIDGVHPGAELFVQGPEALVRATPLRPARGIPTFPSTLTDLATGELYDPQDFSLATRDGRIYNLSIDEGITAYQDRNGNSISFRDDQFASSAGRGFTFVRDAQGRVTQIIDPAGRAVGYDYSAGGDLVAFNDLLNRPTRFEYRSSAHPHHLTDIVDWRGVRIAALDYGADGRVSEMCDADGRCTDATYDLPARSMTYADDVGVPTQYGYDNRGNVTSIRDGLGNETLLTYFHDLLTSRSDPENRVTTWGYRLFSNDLTSRTEPVGPGEDPADFTVRWERDDAGRLAAETLPSGGTVFVDHDADGNETALTDDDANVIIARTWDSTGNVLTETDRFGTTTYEYAGTSPLPTRITDPRGAVTDIAYDSFGEVRRITRAGLTMTFTRDVSGRLLLADYGRGVTVTYEYGDDTDAWTAIHGATFGRVERRVSSAGRLLSWRLPNGDTGSRVYDAAGRLREEVDAVGNSTLYTYDDAARLESVTDVARGATTTHERNRAGDVTAAIDPLGRRTEMVPNARRGVASMLDARGGTGTFSEDAVTSTSTTATGRTTVSHRTEYGLPAGTTLPGGATTATTHDGATRVDESDRFPLTATDEAGRVRRFVYDALGGLSGATDLGGVNEWAYDYDPIVAGDVRWDLEGGRVWIEAPEASDDVYRFTGTGADIGPAPGEDGHEDRAPGGTIDQDGGRREMATMAADAWRHALHTVTSPLGELTAWTRDDRGHLLTHALPNGGLEARTYDELTGYLDTVTRPYGTLLTYTTDVAGRITERAGSDGSLESWTYGPSDHIETVEDDTGLTDYAYDSAGRWTSITHPAGSSWTRAFDSLDRITSVTVRASPTATARTTAYTHDETGNIDTVTDPLGGVTTMEHDLDGRLTSRVLPNGVETIWTYDARGFIDTIVHRAPASAGGAVIASVDYTRSPSGEPDRIDREDGSYVMYDYDSSLRLTGEHYRDSGGGIVRNITYVYDADGNRTRRIVQEGPGGTPVTEDYAYEAGSELARITVGGSTTAEYEYDEAGRTTRITRGADDRTLSWDADDHVVSLTRGTDEYAWDFDAEGRRVRAERRVLGSTVDVVRYPVAPTLVESLESPHAATDDTGVERVGYVFAGEHPLLRYDATTGEPTYYLEDGMGTVIGLVGDDPATETSTIQYDGFGNELATTGSLAGLPSASNGDFRFQGMWLDAGTGLYYVRARVYEEQTGRFLSRDPVAANRGDPATHSPYVHSLSRTTLLRDPSGEMSAPEGLVVTALIGLGANIASGGLFGALRAGTLGHRRATCTGEWDAYSESIITGAIWGAVGGLVGGTFSAVRGVHRFAAGGVAFVRAVIQAVRTLSMRLPVALLNPAFSRNDVYSLIWQTVVAALVGEALSDEALGTLMGMTPITALVGPFVRDLAQYFIVTVPEYIWESRRSCDEY